MSFRNWNEAVKELAMQTVLATPEQQKLGKIVGKPIPQDMPRIVAATTLRLTLAKELNIPPPRPITERYKRRLQILLGPSDPHISPKTEEEAEAWVMYLRFMRRQENLSKLKLNEGDVVETKAGEVAEVSSIGQDGRVFFKGGQGFGSWPDLITVVARIDDDSESARKARIEAKNTAARQATYSKWSMAKSHELSEFNIKNVVSEDDIAELEAVITAAKDERPIQKFIEDNGHLITSLLGGRERYCLPQKRLGGEYIPDFIIGDVDSLGVRWVLIELETPRSGIYLKNGLELDEKARKGVKQVIEWRNWLSRNISYARQRRSDNGLGLFDIREKAEAVVLVGRRALMPKTKDAQRHEYRQSNNIQIHTYDWLLEKLRGAIHHLGPPASNPHLIPKKMRDR